MYGTRQKIGFLLGPAIFILCLLMPEPETMSSQALKVAGVSILMSIWWITEAVPIPATALLPIALFPTLGIMESAASTAPYANHLIYLFFGGFFIAVTMEKWNLHKRIALHIINLVGLEPERIILGFMIATAVLSMWISNMATTMMMVPIALAVISQMSDYIDKKKVSNINSTPTNTKFGATLMLCIAYAASIGGVSTIVGTPPNTVLVGMVEKMYGQQISFASWMAVGLPLSIIMLIITWVYLVKVVCPTEIGELHVGKSWIKDEIKKLGPFSIAEKWILSIFLFVAISWFSRGFINKIDSLKMIHDSTIAIIGATLLFIIPVDFKKGEFLLDWKTAVKVPWGIIILFGGGLSLANGIQVSGLAEWIGSQVLILEGSSMIVLVFAVVLLAISLTNLTSNTATSTMLIPIMGVAAVAMSIHPYALIVAAGIGCSYAFMLPTATPPNAVVFGSGHVTIPQMVRAGLALSIIGCILITIYIVVFLPIIWGIDLGSLPEWVENLK